MREIGLTSHYRNQFWDAPHSEDFRLVKILLPFGEPAADVVPDSTALVVRRGADGGLFGDFMRWGFPPIRAGYVTQVENVAAKYWAPWLTPEYRCLIAATSFTEPVEGHPSAERWFEARDRRVMWLAGIWRPWSGVRGTPARPANGDHRLFALLSTAPCPKFRPGLPRRMPVVISIDQIDTWLRAPFDTAIKLRRQLPASEIRLVADE